jgi:signal transduction histidine kinase
MAPLDKNNFAALPRWAMAAFIARCARRLLPLYEQNDAEPADQRIAVTRAISLAERRAALGGDPDDYDVVALATDGQFVDDYDIDALKAALAGALQAATNTYSDLGDDEGKIPASDMSIGQHTGVILAVTSLAGSSLDAAFGQEMNQEGPDLPELCIQAVNESLFADKVLEPHVLRDFEAVQRAAREGNWDDTTGVAPEVFGELWPDGRPPGWPPLLLSFRPRARIIRTIGDRLISGPEAAVIELIKNSHDADASYARVTFFPPLKQDEGMIIVEDDGHGMTLEDIERKWMEPATTEKRDRRESPGGRHLLGSKGIGRFAASGLGRYLEMISSAVLPAAFANEGAPRIQTTRIAELDWNLFDEAKYLEEVRFQVESLPPAGHSGTVLKVSGLRDDWPEQRLVKLYQELRRLVSPVPRAEGKPFRIFLDLSRCTPEACGFDGAAIVNADSADREHPPDRGPHEVQPFPLLDACDYAVDGVFDEEGVFTGSMTVRRGGQEPDQIRLEVPVQHDDGQEPCGIVLVKLNIFDREAAAIRKTAEKAGFGTMGVREARKLLDNIAGVAIYREGFRIRPYGDSENDWLTLDAKRVQNPTMKIGRNQIAGIVMVDDEESSHLVERSSREGLEENGSFRRLQALISTLLAEVVEPRRRQFRINAGLEERDETNFREIYRRVQMGWSKMLLAKLPEKDRAEVEELVARESDRLTEYLKRLEQRQAQLEAKVTLGLIVGEVMHQGNTPLSFLETESARLSRWWPHLLESTPEAAEDRAEIPRLLNGLGASSGKLRALFNALSPLSGARRGQARHYNAAAAIEQTQYLFKTRMETLGIAFALVPEESGREVFGYPDDLATAVTNLMDNAIYWLHYHDITEPSITVSIRPEDGQCVITVADNGKGIPAEFSDQVFDVGFTLKPNGTGLGLSIAQEAISRSGGELQFLPSTEGAVFQISLPYEKNAEPAQDSETN